MSILPVTLNEGQQKALADLNTFLMNNSANEIILSGAAGTGKTFLINQFIDTPNLTKIEYLKKALGISNFGVKSVILSATTNKAYEVLDKTFTHRKNDFYTKGTVHSVLGLVIRNNFKTGKQETAVARGRGSNKYSNAIVIIDECSMIDKELYHFIKEGLLYENSGNKIIYVGDKYQLPPVSEEMSPIFREDVPILELTEPMRNNTSKPLMALCDQMRDTVACKFFKKIETEQCDIYHFKDLEEAKEKVLEIFVQNKDPNAVILAYRNDKVIKYNNFIRKSLNYPDTFVENERVIASSPYLRGKQTLLKTEESIIISSKAPIESSATIEADSGESFSFTTLFYTLKDIPYNVLTYKDKEEFTRILNTLKKEKDWETFYKLKEEFADLRPSYASTVHKSQGSTYDTVFVDLSDIGTHFKNNEVARMLYVACSRARKQLYLIGNLPNKYGGVV